MSDKPVVGLKIECDEPQIEMVDLPETTPFDAFLKTLPSDFKKNDLSSWSSEQKAEMVGALSQTVIMAFRNKTEAQWKTLMALGDRLLAYGLDSLNVNASFSGCRQGCSEEKFMVSMSVRKSANSYSTKETSADVTIDLADEDDVLSSPKPRMSGLWSDASAVASLWDTLASKLPETDAMEIGSSAAFLLVALEAMAENNAGSLELMLGGLTNDAEGERMETGCDILVSMLRHEIPLTRRPTP